MANVEIFKECQDGKLTMEEVDEILIVTQKNFKFNNDTANGYIAFALSNCSRLMADSLVNRLNTICQENGDDTNWFLGDENEEYVFVN